MRVRHRLVRRHTETEGSVIDETDVTMKQSSNVIDETNVTLKQSNVIDETDVTKNTIHARTYDYER